MNTLRSLLIAAAVAVSLAGPALAQDAAAAPERTQHTETTGEGVQ